MQTSKRTRCASSDASGIISPLWNSLKVMQCNLNNEILPCLKVCSQPADHIQLRMFLVLSVQLLMIQTFPAPQNYVGVVLLLFERNHLALKTIIGSVAILCSNSKPFCLLPRTESPHMQHWAWSLSLLLIVFEYEGKLYICWKFTENFRHILHKFTWLFYYYSCLFVYYYVSDICWAVMQLFLDMVVCTVQKIIFKKNLKPRCRHMMTMSLPQLEKHKRAHEIGLFAEHVVHQYTYG